MKSVFILSALVMLSCVTNMFGAENQTPSRWSFDSYHNPFNLFRSNKDNFNTCTNPENCDILGVGRKNITTDRPVPDGPIGIKAKDGTKYIGHKDHTLKWGQRWSVLFGVHWGILAGLNAIGCSTLGHAAAQDAMAGHPVSGVAAACVAGLGLGTLVCTQKSLCAFSNARRISTIRTQLAYNISSSEEAQQHKQEQRDVPYSRLSVAPIGEDKHTINSREYFWQIFRRNKLQHNVGKMQ